jgi:hypothetical protein
VDSDVALKKVADDRRSVVQRENLEDEVLNPLADLAPSVFTEVSPVHHQTSSAPRPVKPRKSVPSVPVVDTSPPTVIENNSDVVARNLSSSHLSDESGEEDLNLS